VPIQAVVGKKVVARETLSAMRADVTAGLYGGAAFHFASGPRKISDPGLIFFFCCLGHYERKMKHLENQKESKRRMKRVGSVELPQEAFFDILRTKSS
jgi:translation factor GUF1, mitochondrial